MYSCVRMFLLASILPTLALSQNPTTSWQPVFPYPTGGDLYAITSVGGVLTAVGTGGTMVTSSDGGQTWRLHPYVGGTTETFKALAYKYLSKTVPPLQNFPTAIAVGTNGTIVRTTNGGTSWSKATSGSTRNLYGISFNGIDNPVNGTGGAVAVGDSGTILYSSNSGSSWNSISSPTSSRIVGVSFSPVIAGLGIASAANGDLLRTKNGGTSWTPLGNFPISPRQVRFIDTAKVIVLDNVSFFISSDSGSNWSQNFISNSDSLVKNFQCFAAWNKDTILVGSEYRLWRTTENFGSGWHLWPPRGQTERDILYYGLVFVNNTTAIAVGYGGVIARTTNAGDDWTTVAYGASGSYKSVSFSDEKHGWVVGENSAIVRTTNGGQSWAALSGYPWSNVHEDQFHGYRGVHFINNDTGWVVGDLGKILRTYDGGVSWADRNTGSSSNNAVHFFNAETGIVVGTGGFYGQVNYPNDVPGIYRTTNGGDTWAIQESLFTPGTRGHLYNMCFVDANHGWAVGDTGSYPSFVPGIAQTTDGGLSWTDSLLPFAGSFKGIFFRDISHGWAVGMKGIYPSAQPLILQTTNGGTSWSEETGHPYFSSALNASFENVFFISSAVGFVVGSSRIDPAINPYVPVPAFGALAFTTNGGLSWSRDTSSAAYLKDISFAQIPGFGFVGFSVGAGIYCSATIVGPVQTDTWTGAVDSNWNNGANWSLGIAPLKFHHVLISPNSIHPDPVIFHRQDIVAIASLYLADTLTVRDSVRQFVVKGPVTRQAGGYINAKGTHGNYLFGGGFIVIPGFLSNASGSSSVSAVAGSFIDLGNSSASFRGTGDVFGNYYDLIFDSSSVMRSAGGISVENTLTVLKRLDVNDNDTVEVTNADPQSIQGDGKVEGGTISRKIQVDASDQYRFESSGSFVRFDVGSTYPDLMDMTVKAGSTPRAFELNWEPVPVSQRSVTDHTIRAYPVQQSTKYVIGIPGSSLALRKTGSILYDPNFKPKVKRIYSVRARGGGGGGLGKTGASPENRFQAELSLRYEPSEVDSAVVEDSLVLARGPVAVDSVVDGWNMVALPVVPENTTKDTVFPGAISRAYNYNGSYQIQTTLAPQTGYWLKYPSRRAIAILGNDQETAPVIVKKGWNLIGALSYAVSASTVIPSSPGLLASQFFGYSRGYKPAATLSAMRAYWIKANADGSIFLDANAVASAKTVSPLAALNDLNALTISDNSGTGHEIYFGGNVDPAQFELPPLPPEGVCDVRLSTNRMVEVADRKNEKVVPIKITSALYPVTIRWQIKDESYTGAIRVGGVSRPLHGTGSVTVDDPSSAILLVLSPVPRREIPVEFALRQNFPNPFNPSTTIRYELPEGGRVALRIYNILGQLVATPIDEVQPSGFKSVVWNSGGSASGVYFYRLEVTTNNKNVFLSTMKMVLLR